MRKFSFFVLITMAVFIFTIVVAFAQEVAGAASSLPPIPWGGDWLEWLHFAIPVVCWILYEIVIRFIKTHKSRSLITVVIKLLMGIDNALPDKDKSGGHHKHLSF